MVFTTQQRLMSLGVATPLAKELGNQLDTGTYNVFRLVEMGMDAGLAKIVVTEPFDKAKAVQLGMIPAVATLVGGGVAPPFSGILYIRPGYGQSLSLGRTDAGLALPFVNTYPEEVLSFGGTANNDIRMGISPGVAVVLDPGTLTSFVALIAKYGVPGANLQAETMLEQSAKVLARAARARGERHQFLSFTAGAGGAAYSDIAKGTQLYTNFMAAVGKGVTIALALGLVPKVLDVPIAHGEADSADPDYADYMLELWADMNPDIKALTGQTEDIRFSLNQPSSFFATTGGAAANAIYELGISDPTKFSVVGPNYNLEYSSDFLHLNPQGYHDQGERLGVVDNTVSYEEEAWTGTRLRSFAIVGSEVTFTIDTPTSPAVIDTVAVSNPGNYGISFSDSRGTVVSSVQLTGANAGKAVLSQAPIGASRKLFVGGGGHVGTREAATIPRTNIRDSSAISNWAQHCVYAFDGEELLLNGTFDANINNWTGAGGTASWQAPGRIRIQRLTTAGRRYQDISGLTIGATYRCTYDFVKPGTVNGLIAISIASGSTTSPVYTSGSITASEDGRVFTFVATQTTHGVVLVQVGGVDGDYVEFDNITFQQVL